MNQDSIELLKNGQQMAIDIRRKKEEKEKEKERRKNEAIKLMIKQFRAKASRNSKYLNRYIIHNLCQEFLKHYSDPDQKYVTLKVIFNDPTTNKVSDKDFTAFREHYDRLYEEYIVFVEKEGFVHSLPAVLDFEQYKKHSCFVVDRKSLSTRGADFRILLTKALKYADDPTTDVFDEEDKKFFEPYMDELVNTAFEMHWRDRIRDTFLSKCRTNEQLIYLDICKKLITRYKNNPNFTDETTYEIKKRYFVSMGNFRDKIGEEKYREYVEVKDFMPKDFAVCYTKLSKDDPTYLEFLPSELKELFSFCKVDFYDTDSTYSTNISTMSVSIEAKKLEELLVSADQVEKDFQKESHTSRK